MPKISATIISYNGERDIEDCLRSLSWVDEIIVADSHSTDRTVPIAQKYTDKVLQSPGRSLSDHKNFAADQATGDWILHLDVDERCTDELAAEIRQLAARSDAADGYYIPRRTFWIGKWIRYGGWYPDYTLRLFRKGKAHCEGITHERIVVPGPTGLLSNALLHYSYRSIQAHIERMILRAAPLEVQEAVANQVRIYPLFPWAPFKEFVTRFWRGPKTGLAFRLLYKDIIKNRVEIAWLIPFMPLIRFVYMYVFRLGFLDGVPGFWVAMYSAFYEAVRYGKLWEYFYRQRQTDRAGIDPREVWEQSSLKV